MHLCSYPCFVSRLISFIILLSTLTYMSTWAQTAPAETTRSTDEVWYLRTTDSVRLFVREMGVGDTVLILHGGWGAEHHYLLDAFEDLKDEYHLVFYDQRGSLRSPCPDSMVSVERHLSDLEELRRSLGLDRMNLIGHSMGTWLAGYYLDSFPHRVRRMILCGLVYPKTPSTKEEAELWQTQQRRAAEFIERPAIGEEIREEGLDRTNLSDRERTYKWRIRFAGSNIYHIERWREVVGGQAYYDQSAGRAAGRSMPDEWDFTEAFASSEIPIHVIQGTHDIADMNAEMAISWMGDLPNVKIHLIDEAGHNAWIDDPETFIYYVTNGLE